MGRPILYDQEGRTVRLGAELGRGGEGTVFAVDGDRADQVAKIYHQSLSPDKADKLAVMVGQRSADLLRVAAWPVGVLASAPGAPAVGLLMPKVTGHKPIHTLYGPKSRLVEFPQATWSFLVQTAANVARALAVVHAAGSVVGDINHGNLLVSSQATVKLIDCDSFQITVGDRRFLCEVGVSTHTPPELQGESLRTLPRTPNHDAFGLAVMAFQLLFLGRHPFSGTYLGPGDMPLERAIRELRFAYGRAAPQRQMRQPPHTPPLEIASPPVVALFERAFAPKGAGDGGRPGAIEWIAALDGLELQTCARQPAHTYAACLESCPWCPLEITTPTILFKVAKASPSSPAEVFDAAAAWARITAVPTPGAAPPMPHAALEEPPQGVAWFGIWTFFAFLFVALVFDSWLASELGGTVLWLWLTVLTLLVFGGYFRFTIFPVWQALAALRAAEERLAALKSAWKQQTGESSFRATLEHLEEAKRTYLGLPALRLRQLAKIEEDLHQKQLERFLNRQPVAGSGFEQGDLNLVAILQSYGIETAADVVADKIGIVPGLGAERVDRLLAWRRQLEGSFVFDPSQGLHHDDLADLEETLDEIRRQSEADLLAGPARLVSARQRTLHARQTLGSQIRDAIGAYRMAVNRIFRWVRPRPKDQGFGPEP